MSITKILLPSPSIENGPRDHMTGLFYRSNQLGTSSNALSNTGEVDSDSAARKRVEFQTWTTNISDVLLSTPNSENIPSLKLLPPSRTCQQTKRPILKTNTSTESVIGSDVQLEKKSALADMESLLGQLAHNDRLSSLDAYQTMVTLIKTYEHPPEEVKVQEKMPLLQKYLKRDLLILDKDSDSLSSEHRLSMQNLVVSAIKLLVTIVWVPAYATCLSDDFRIWTVERAVQVINDHSSKVIVLHYMHFLATQNYHDNVLVGNKRASRLLEILHKLPDRFSGKSILAERLLIFQKLIDQAKAIMRARPDLWVGHLFISMSHSFKDIRTNAISVGTRACTVFREVDGIAIEARKQLAQEKGERTLSSSITNRLENILAAKDDGNQIPQIWTIVILLCNSDSQKLESWPQFQDWVRVIQRCFNCSDATIKAQAYMAWNRLYYIAQPHQASESILSLLAKPTVLQLERTGSTASKGTRQAVISSFAMLLYYAFRPAVKPQQYTRMWNEFVVKIMTRSFLSKSTSNCDLCCRVLSALFHGSSAVSRLWNEQRALENAPLDPLELPAIDCKWIRSQISGVLVIFDLLVQHSSFGPDGQVSEQAYASQAWTNLMRAVRESSSKEIVTSPETKAALVCITNFLQDQPLENTEDITPSSLEPRLALLRRITVTELGSSLRSSILDNISGVGNMMIIEEILATVKKPKSDSEVIQPIDQKIIDQCLEKCITEVENSLLESTLNASISIFSYISALKTPQSLIKVQDRIVSMIKGHHCHFTVEDVDTFTELPFHRFIVGVTNVLLEIPLSLYHLFDDLIAAILSSSCVSLKTYLLDMWEMWKCQDEQHEYGPKLLDICEKNQEQILVFLPGIRNLNLTKLDEKAGTDTNIETDSTERIIATTPTLAETVSIETTTDSTTRANVLLQSTTENMPAESLPFGPIFESQLLISHHQQVPQNQAGGLAIHFADVQAVPSVLKKRNVTTPEPLSRRKRMSELDVTPTSPSNQPDEELHDAPTPTPTARRFTQSSIRPEVASSPASISGVDELDVERSLITSSPVKDALDVMDVVQLGQVEVSIQIQRAPEVQVLVPKLKSAKLNSPREPLRSLIETLSHNLPDLVDNLDSHTKPKPAEEPEALSPWSEADEYDVLASSQLTQNLEEQSFVTTREIGSTETSQAKRKHQDISSVDEQRTKRRKSSEDLQDEKMLSDCITIGVEPAEASLPGSRSRRKKRVTGKRKSNQNSDSRSSSSIESSPNTQLKATSQSGRSLRSSRTNPNTNPSEESSQPAAAKHIEGLIGENEEEAAQSEKACREEGENGSQTLSLDSEVPETVQTEEILFSESRIDNSAASATDDVDQEMTVEVSPEIVREDTYHVKASSVVDELQEILSKMNNPTVGTLIPSEQELATIHSLCFKIGMKAQEWSALGS